VILRLSLLGWTQEAIGEKVGLERSVVARTVQNYDFVEIHNYALKNGVPKAAEHFGFDEPLIWAIVGREKDDQKLLADLGIKLRLATLLPASPPVLWRLPTLL